MKKLMIAVACIAVAFATMSCSKKTNDPDSINLKDYNPQDAPSCWAVTVNNNNASATTYTWANEYTIALSCKTTMELSGTKSVYYSWEKVSGDTEEACLQKNQD